MNQYWAVSCQDSKKFKLQTCKVSENFISEILANLLVNCPQRYLLAQSQQWKHWNNKGITLTLFYFHISTRLFTLVTLKK